MGKLITVFVPVREQQLESKANFAGKMASRGPVDVLAGSSWHKYGERY